MAVGAAVAAAGMVLPGEVVGEVCLDGVAGTGLVGGAATEGGEVSAGRVVEGTLPAMDDAWVVFEETEAESDCPDRPTTK